LASICLKVLLFDLLKKSLGGGRSFVPLWCSILVWWTRSCMLKDKLRIYLSSELSLTRNDPSGLSINLISASSQLNGPQYHPHCKKSEWVSDCCLMPIQQFFSHIMASRSYFSMRWSWWSSFCWIFIVLAHWNNSLRIDMSLHSDTLFWFWANQSLLLLLNAACLAEKQQIPILYSFVCLNLGSNPRSISLEASTLAL
jgi:hypothetical protein